MFNFFKRPNKDGLLAPEKVYAPPGEIPPDVRHWMAHVKSERRFPISETDHAVLVRFLIEYTYSGILESEDVRRSVLDDLARRAEQVMGGGGLYVHMPPPGKPPYFTCMARMEAGPMDESFFSSVVTICWFQDELPRNIYATVGEKVYGIDWRKYAVDCMP